MSRNIDLLIAEHIMGLTFNGSHWINESEGTVGRLGVEPPEYSTNINSAWEVVEIIGNTKEAPESERFMVRVGRIERGNYYCEIERRVYAGEPDTFTARSESPAMAICLAALKVKGIEV